MSRCVQCGKDAAPGCSYCSDECREAEKARVAELMARRGEKYRRELAAMGLVSVDDVGPAGDPLQALRLARRARCAHCSAELERGRSDRRYCGARCRVAAMRQRRTTTSDNLTTTTEGMDAQCAIA